MERLRCIEFSKKVYDKLLNDIAKNNDLTLNEYKILLFLKNNKGSSFEKDIVDAIGSVKSHVSMSVTNLENKGFIIKTKDDNNKKKYKLELTPKADDIILSGMNALKQLRSIMFKDISKEELEMLANISKKIENNLKDYNNN